MTRKLYRQSQIVKYGLATGSTVETFYYYTTPKVAILHDLRRIDMRSKEAKTIMQDDHLFLLAFQNGQEIENRYMKKVICNEFLDGKCEGQGCIHGGEHECIPQCQEICTHHPHAKCVREY